MAKVSRISGDVISGGLLAGLGVFILIEARNWPYSSTSGPGAGFFPTSYGIAIVVLSLFLMVKSLLNPAKEENEAVDRLGVFRGLSTWVAFALAVALLKPLGFIVSFALLTFFIVAVVFRRSLVVAGATALATAVGFYVVFPLALSVALPVGYLGF
jgi:putative tricarboxylic transport membrane protein